MKQSVRPALLAGFALILLSWAPRAVSSAHASFSEIHLNSSSVQVVHNTPANSDVLNMNLNVTNIGDGGTGDCNGELNDLLESGFIIGVSRFSCATVFTSCGGICEPDFGAEVTYVEHDIGSFSYGTSFAPNLAGSVASKIVALATLPNTCGTWSINLQATGQNLSLITGPKVALLLIDADFDAGPAMAAACFDVNATVGNGIAKPHQGAHRARH